MLLTERAFAVQQREESNPTAPILQMQGGSAEAGFLKSADGDLQSLEVSEGQRKPQGCSRHLEIGHRDTQSLHPACPPYLRPTLK